MALKPPAGKPAPVPLAGPRKPGPRKPAVRGEGLSGAGTGPIPQGGASARLAFSANLVAPALAAVIAVASTFLLALTLEVPAETLWITAFLVFVSSFVLVYGVLEFFIFREINRLFSVIDRLKKKDFKRVRKNLKGYSFNPISRLNDEIFTFASKKEQEIDQLKELETYRREFVADISHELKTPIFAAQGYILTLMDGAKDDPEVRDRFLKRAAKSLEGLEALVEDLVTLSQMETGVIQMHLGPFDLVGLVNEVFDQLEKKAAKKEVTVRLDKGTPATVMVHADRNRIRQVLINLVENGIKYGNERGQVLVGLEPEKEYITISVRDDGPGIPEEHRSRIFERFYRVEKSRSKDRGGSGLGLAIVKQIVEAHGSKVIVNSRPGKGTNFYFKLRRARSEASAVPAA